MVWFSSTLCNLLLRAFTDVYTDDWITIIYQPARSSKLQSVLLNHTMELGVRHEGPLQQAEFLQKMFKTGTDNVNK